MKKISLDTNAVLCYLLNDISSQHKSVKELVVKASKKKIVVKIPEIVVFETVFTLRTYYGFRKDKIIDALEIIVSAAYLDVENRNIFLKAVSLFRQNNIEFVDCFLVAKCGYDGYESFSFDKKMNKLFKSMKYD